jgi:RNA polymerase subunit RPABC4/transcription elongation factor Spt4
VTERLDDRCPRCSALVRADSPWCTLCYADLRPQQPAYAASVAEAPSAPQSTAPAAALSPAPSPWAPDAPAFDPLTAPFSVLEAASLPAQSLPLPPEAVPAPAAEPTAASSVDPTPAAAPEAGKLVGWPCIRCHTLVPLDELSCPTCGSSFLAEARGEPDLFSRFSRGGVSKTTQAMIIGVGSLAFIIVVMGLLYLASLFL